MNPILLTIWGVLAACFAGLLVYRGQLTRYEDEQLFLNEELHQNEQEQQTAIVRKVQKLKPVLGVLGGAAGLCTACVVGLYVWDAWQRLQ